MKKYFYLLNLLVTLGMIHSCASIDDNTSEKTPNNSEIIFEKDNEKSLLIFTKEAMEYALSTEKLLGENLKSALAEGGTEGALSFCNINAISLTQSMEEKYNAKIKRATDKARNQSNLADEEELEQIAYFKELIDQGKTRDEIKPITTEQSTGFHLYYPIVTNGMCLQCHGIKNENVSLETLTSLSKLYPEDNALGYGIDEVRGIWSIWIDK